MIPFSFVNSIHQSSPELQVFEFVGATIVPSSCNKENIQLSGIQCLFIYLFKSGKFIYHMTFTTIATHFEITPLHKNIEFWGDLHTCHISLIYLHI